MNYKVQKLKQIIKIKYIKFILFFIGYILLEILVNKINITLPTLFSSFALWYSISFVLLNLLIIPTLVSLTIIISIEKIHDLQSISIKSGVIPFFATFATLLGGACPGCFIGLFPAVMGIFGSTLQLRDLPFAGLEIQVVSAIILIISLNYLTRKTTCKI